MSQACFYIIFSPAKPIIVSELKSTLRNIFYVSDGPRRSEDAHENVTQNGVVLQNERGRHGVENAKNYPFPSCCRISVEYICLDGTFETFFPLAWMTFGICPYI